MKLISSSALLLLVVLFTQKVNAQLPWSEDFSSYTNPSGIEGTTGNVGDYPTTTPWTLDASGASLTATSDYGYVNGAGLFQVQDSDGPFVWTSHNIDITGCANINFSVDLSEVGTMEALDYINVEYSTNGSTFTLVTDWMGLGDATHTVIDDFTSTTVTQTGLSGTTFILRVTFECNAAAEQLRMDNISVNGTCSTNTIASGAVTGAAFDVDCAGTTDNGTVAFTSVGTFNAGNVYTAQLSDASGSFASPISIGTLTSTANSGTINITIPAAMAGGAGYLIRVISDNPAVIGTSSSSFTINQNGSCGPGVSEGLIINEWSNGPSGNQEYYEFVVAGQCGTSVDIRGYILDDNNGTFTAPAAYSGTASGIAPGHFRFSNAAQWGAIPVGSLIVIYNAGDPNPALPPDDPTDANTDSLYVVPHTNPLFESCTAFPTSSSPDSIYVPCTYTSGGNWSPLSLRNSGDAIQVRFPDGSYYHGVSYGGAEITGGPDNLKQFTGSGSNMCGWFSDGDFFDVSNWTSGATTGNQTPGAPNNALNQAWLQLMRDPAAINCPITVLPVELMFFNGKKEGDANKLIWATASEINSAYFTIEHSTDGKTWDEIDQQACAGNSTSVLNYQFYDLRFAPELNYYRLSQTDFDGTITTYDNYVAIDNRIKEDVYRVKIVNLLGQEIKEDTSGVQIHVFNDGSSIKYWKQ